MQALDEFVDPVSLCTLLSRKRVVIDGEVSDALIRYRDALAKLAYHRLSAATQATCAGFDPGPQTPPQLEKVARDSLKFLRKEIERAGPIGAGDA